ncbi:hypothetical protein [Pseudarthrobacter sp. S9]|uniref:hypothetical protein n=1 Tax=Pseudarthrobacter sp. S9 TaxID=3418421 RepID=UPI003D087050
MSKVLRAQPRPARFNRLFDRDTGHPGRGRLAVGDWSVDDGGQRQWFAGSVAFGREGFDGPR